MTPKWMQVLVLFTLSCALAGCSSKPSVPLGPSAQPDTSSAPPVAAAQAIGSTKINPMDSAEMVYVPAGEFTMGSTKADVERAVQSLPPRVRSDAEKDSIREEPQHKVTLDNYWIYKNDVTVAQYRKFCSATGRTMPDAPPWGWEDDHPVVKVTWDDAAAYAGWAKVHLPTEAQWEKAARGTDGRIYPWGNDWDKTKANSSEGGPGQTTPVGSYPGGASPYGCLDMAGNVFQWCADWYGPYDAAATKNPAGPATGDYFRVLRGGSWNYHSDNCRSAYRNNISPSYWDITYGFRCVGPAGLS